MVHIGSLLSANQLEIQKNFGDHTYQHTHFSSMLLVQKVEEVGVSLVRNSCRISLHMVPEFNLMNILKKYSILGYMQIVLDVVHFFARWSKSLRSHPGG